MSANWIGFDLDDTLHEFTAASRKASRAVFEHVVNRSSVGAIVSIDILHAHYQAICREYVTSFTDGRPSYAYRFERMHQLLERSGIRDLIAADLVEIYASAIEGALRLNVGAYELINALKRLGYKIAVISEGPHDAQSRTLEKLGLAPLIDRLLTSNKASVSKKDGLFQIFLDDCAVETHRSVVIGDSVENDIVPAEALGIITIHYDAAPDKQTSIPSPARYSISELPQTLQIIRDLHEGLHR